MALTNQELRLIALLLEKASDKFSRHGCTEFCLLEDGGIESREDRKSLRIAMEEWNGDEEQIEFLKSDNGSHRYTDDWYLMSYLGARCLDTIKQRANDALQEADDEVLASPIFRPKEAFAPLAGMVFENSSTLLKAMEHLRADRRYGVPAELSAKDLLEMAWYEGLIGKLNGKFVFLAWDQVYL